MFFVMSALQNAVVFGVEFQAWRLEDLEFSQAYQQYLQESGLFLIKKLSQPAFINLCVCSFYFVCKRDKI